MRVSIGGLVVIALEIVLSIALIAAAAIYYYKTKDEAMLCALGILAVGCPYEIMTSVAIFCED